MIELSIEELEKHSGLWPGLMCAKDGCPKRNYAKKNPEMYRMVMKVPHSHSEQLLGYADDELHLSKRIKR